MATFSDRLREEEGEGRAMARNSASRKSRAAGESERRLLAIDMAWVSGGSRVEEIAGRIGSSGGSWLDLMGFFGPAIAAGLRWPAGGGDGPPAGGILP